ncbi:ABC transporter ATP-binding protein [Alkalicoccus saliphilus]|uniref:ABC transporter ATP-binding protein n=1 Tax=Alkalicoccus saliphilus TaxID=200989 RepID=A0A2T4U744_9BACI|nr:ABC transporter ATP-binding protein [Alkalicoccus saliphilus]PTL39228.1 ABC transporter ATP-binding protein [Alkalicoccus saliphilus]
MGSVQVKNLVKKYDKAIALKGVDLDIKEGEFYALLGPSGCGKTTTMRCIAGFETPTSGEILIGDKVVNNVPANRRNCGMVFQSYALFPHYNVFENVAYSLTIRDLYSGSLGQRIKTFGRLMSKRLGKPTKEIEKKVQDALDYVELGHLADRGVNELSGGQQQRVALARALVMEPSVLLMDEPLSNLDKKLRNTMRTTIRKIQQDLKITTIFVTHDQEEAMSMADHVAVMRDGEIVQMATPTELYSNPKDPFVADFVGSSNIYKGQVLKKNEKGNTVVKITDEIVLESETHTDKSEVEVLVRPEGIEIIREASTPKTENVVEAKVKVSTYLGPTIRYDIELDGMDVMVEEEFQPNTALYKEGDIIKVHLPSERVLLI